jgi:tRNA (guanine10-N2)-methyltransferase
VISRSILAHDVLELWGKGANHEELHADVRRRTEHRWPDYKDVSFRFVIDTFAAKRTQAEKGALMESFAYLDLQGPISMKNPDEDFVILEEYLSYEERLAIAKETGTQMEQDNEKKDLKFAYFGRWVCASSREMMSRYDLKKRKYISTTSMDAELSLVTANMALAAPGKIFFDPFVGTGSFLVAAAYFGAMTLGADIDGRSFKGKHTITKENPIGLLANFKQYGTENRFIDAFTSDLTNTPMRDVPFLDGIICDPPYGIREGLKVLGIREGRQAREVEYIDGKPDYT